MKKIILIVFGIGLVAFILYAYSLRESIYTKFTTHDIKALANLRFYKSSNERLKKKPAVVFIGNSITQDWEDKRPEFFSSNNYVSRGIGGQFTSQMLLRFRQDVIDLHPEVVVINGGINDLAEPTGYDPDFSFSNIISMAELAKANNIKVIMPSLTPVKYLDFRMDIMNVPDKIEAMNQRIKEYAEKNNILYVDYYSALVSEERGLKPIYVKDQVHPNPEGFKAMEPLIKEAIDEVLNQSR